MIPCPLPHRFVALLASAILWLALGTPLANALTIPHARFLERVTCPGQTRLGADPLLSERVLVDVPNCFGRAETSGTGVALPGASPPYAEAVLSTGGTAGGLVSARVDYNFGVGAVSPGLAGESVPIIIHATLLVEFDAPEPLPLDFDGLSATIGLGSGGGFTRTACIPSGPLAGCSDRRADLAIPLSLLADVDIQGIELAVFAQGGGPLSLRAVADPFIEIDPLFSDRDLFRIVVSEGVTNEAPASPSPIGVPEPSMLLLLGSGLAASGFARWARRPRLLGQHRGSSG